MPEVAQTIERVEFRERSGDLARGNPEDSKSRVPGGFVRDSIIV